MSYQVLARKWRPANFSQVVGQEHVLQSLINALEQNRLHHAYLFSGTRGVGKTSIARLLAKALNCEQGVSATPCEQCSSCQEISRGSFVDLIEIDAASKTKVEDTREILDNVQYKPTRGRYKVYLIDEVHMLSRSSFNALLKTLEEPPEHVKFLFATTETQKLPVTILSRCLQFNLKALTPALIEGQLKYILEQEKVVSDQESLVMLADAAQGSMRDALSLTDQAISYGNGELSQANVSLMLGTLDPSYSLKLLESLTSENATELFELIEELNEFAPDYDKLLKQITLDVHYASMAKVVKQSVRLSDKPPQLWQFANSASAELLQLYYSILLQGRKELPWAADPRSGFEMVMLRLLAFKPAQKKTSLIPEDQPKTNPLADPKGQGDSEDTTTEQQALAVLVDEQQSLIDAASAIKSQSVINNVEIPEPKVKPPQMPRQTEQANIESANTMPVQEISATPDKPAISDNLASSAFSEEELFNMSMAMAQEEPEYIDSLDVGVAINEQVEPMPQSAVVTPSTQPITGIDQFLKARKSLKIKAKATEPQTKESDVKKTPAVKDNSADKASPLLQVKKLANCSSNMEMVAETAITQAKVEHVDESVLDEDVIGPVTQSNSLQANVVVANAQDLSSSAVDDPATLLAPNTQDYWSLLIDAMALGGRIRQLAIHSSYQKVDQQVTLTLVKAHRHLGVDTAVNTLQKSLSLALELPIELEVLIGDSDDKTPFVIAQELHHQRLELAGQCIKQDQAIIHLEQHFAAQIDPQSIKYRTIKAIN